MNSGKTLFKMSYLFWALCCLYNKNTEPLTQFQLQI